MSNIVITGDTYLGDPRIESLAIAGNTTELFGSFLEVLESAELAITNLESPITNHNIPLVKMGPALKAAPESLRILKQAGFDLLTLGNNHILDYGVQGLRETLNECEVNALSTIGAGLDEISASKVFYKELSGMKIAFLNFAENEFSTTKVASLGAHPVDPIHNFTEIKDIREKADKLIVIVHGGREHYPLPSPNFQDLLRYYAELGADVVVAHHTHCVSGYEIYKDTPIFYGLGNFLFNNLPGRNRPLWNRGAAVKLRFSDSDKVVFDFIPFDQCQGEDVGIVALDQASRSDFFKNVEKLNEIIQNRHLLEKSWQGYIESQKNGYLNNLFIGNKYLKKLVNRKILSPSLFRGKQHLLVCHNLVQCETHREILLDALNEEGFKKINK